MVSPAPSQSIMSPTPSQSGTELTGTGTRSEWSATSASASTVLRRAPAMRFRSRPATESIITESFVSESVVSESVISESEYEYVTPPRTPSESYRSESELLQTPTRSSVLSDDTTPTATRTVRSMVPSEALEIGSPVSLSGRISDVCWTSTESSRSPTTATLSPTTVPWSPSTLPQSPSTVSQSPSTVPWSPSTVLLSPTVTRTPSILSTATPSVIGTIEDEPDFESEAETEVQSTSYSTASQGTDFLTATPGSSYATPSEGTSYRSLEPVPSEGYDTASECESGVTAECWCPQRTPPSSVPSSISLPDVPMQSVADLSSPPSSPSSESTPTPSTTVSTSSVASRDFFNVPPPSTISRAPSIVPTIPTLTPSASISSRHSIVELERSVSPASSLTPSVDIPRIGSEFGDSEHGGSSVSFEIEAPITPIRARSRTPTASVTGSSVWVPSPSSLHTPVPHPSPPREVWDYSPSESSESSDVTEETDVASSLQVPAAPPASLERAPSIRSIRSLWATETDVSFDESLLNPSPSSVSAPLPRVETEPVPLTISTPTISTPTSTTISTPTPTPSEHTPIQMPTPAVSTATITSEPSSVSLHAIPRPQSPSSLTQESSISGEAPKIRRALSASTWDDSGETDLAPLEWRSASPSTVSSATADVSTLCVQLRVYSNEHLIASFSRSRATPC